MLDLDPLSTETVEELRRAAAASRADPRVMPTTPPAPAQPPPVPPIVGTFLALSDCTAAVPAEQPANGQLGDDELCPIGDGHQLRADAAATYVAMDEAFAATFGESLCISDSYRSFGAQQSLYWQKPNLAAAPGTSNHGWGMAVDLFCGIDDPGSAEHAWLDENGDDFGWVNPSWAQPGGSRPEPWHWEFEPSLLD